MVRFFSQLIVSVTTGVAAVLLAALVTSAGEARLAAQPAAIQLTSPAFRERSAIPAKYACEGANMSPPLAWGGAPAGTKSFALICDDPDAPSGAWVHWVIYSMPPSATELAEGVAASETLPDGSKQGMNDFGRPGYGGPCPPPDTPHRYFFKLYALDAELTLKPRATKRELLKAMKSHILAQGQLMGTFERR